MVLITVKNEFQLIWASETGFSRACLQLRNWSIDWPVCCGIAFKPRWGHPIWSAVTGQSASHVEPRARKSPQSERQLAAPQTRAEAEMPSVPRQSHQMVQQKKAGKPQCLLNVLRAACLLAVRFGLLNGFDGSQVFRALRVPQSAGLSQGNTSADQVQNQFSFEPEGLGN